MPTSKVVGIDHMSIRVSDYQKSKAFYSKLFEFLGFEISDEYPGTIGPELVDMKSKYPKREDLVAIIYDETKRNPQTMMPPFGRNRILTEQEISAIVDFLQTL